MNNKGIFGLVGGAVFVIVALIVAFASIDVTKIHGNQIGVMETWSGGVEDKLYEPKTYMYAGTSELYAYDLTPQRFEMDAAHNNSYIARSSDNQTMTMDIGLQWHYDRTKLLNIHKTYRAHVGVSNWSNIIEERIILQNFVVAVNSAVASRKAIEAYSGATSVAMQEDILKKLQDPNGELVQNGIVVETFVINQIQLDKAYIKEIEGRQVAQQRELRAKQEELAALAEAQRAKAEASTEYEQVVMKARQQKEQGVLESEGKAQQQINAARAQAEQQVIEAEGQAKKIVLAANAERTAAQARAEAILALGQAEAEAKKLNMLAYSGAGADNFVTIEVSKSMATAFSGIQGYIPQGMTVNTFTTNWMEGLGIFGRKSVTATK